MKKMGGIVCDFCRSPIAREAVREGRALRHLRHGHVPRFFCWSECVRWYLEGPNGSGLDARTKAELEAMARKEEIRRLGSVTLREVRRSLARAKRGWITREEAANFIDVGITNPQPTDPSHWIATRDELRLTVEAWHRARHSANKQKEQAKG